MTETAAGGGREHRPRRFYEIHDNGDGTVDIYLDKGRTFPMTDDLTGATDWDGCFRVVKGVTVTDGLEEDIRKRYEDWYEAAEVIWL